MMICGPDQERPVEPARELLGDAQPERDADHAAHDRQRQRLDQELGEDVDRGCAPTAIRSPISRVRSVTLTSMMFMIPMPPTSSDTAAMLASSVVSVLRPLLLRAPPSR